MKKIVVTAFSAFLILSFISCGSKPAPEETKEPEAPVVTEEVVVEEVEETVEPVDNSLVLQNVDDARNLAVESGAEESAADLLKSVDDLFAQIKAKSEEGQDVSKEAADIANRYSAIASYVKAKYTKQKIDDENLSSFAQSTYDEGCTVYAELETMFTNSEVTGEQLLEQATKAYTCFNSVLNIAYKQIAKDERSAAFVEKKNADSVKAGVAQKEKYNEAVELFKKGDTLYSMQNPEKAYENYKSSKEIFAAVYAEVSEKRAEAQKAIDEAKKRVSESAALANEADLNSPITEKVDGIEEEDTVLLEEETFADPTQAEADLPETLDGENEEVVEETTALEEENTEEVAKLASGWTGKAITAEMVADRSYRSFVDAISPASLVNENTVPTLCAYGPKDKIVPVDIKFVLFENFDKYGVTYDFINFENSGHGMLGDADK